MNSSVFFTNTALIVKLKLYLIFRTSMKTTHLSLNWKKFLNLLSQGLNV